MKPSERLNVTKEKCVFVSIIIIDQLSYELKVTPSRSSAGQIDPHFTRMKKEGRINPNLNLLS